MSPALIVALSVMFFAAGVALQGMLWALPRLPEPPVEPGVRKVPYKELPEFRLATAAAVWATALTLAATASLPERFWAPYVLVAVIGSVGCAIDAATTWLPKRILHVGWVLTPPLLVWCSPQGVLGWESLIRAAVGAAAAGALLLLAHVVARFGLSDARLALLTGAISAWVSWATLLNAMVIGSVVGALWGVLHAARRGRSSAFAYGPSLLFGPYLAVLLSAVTR